eukprot:15440626-Alexandrium_andersonii.AAC.1
MFSVSKRPCETAQWPETRPKFRRGGAARRCGDCNNLRQATWARHEQHMQRHLVHVCQEASGAGDPVQQVFEIFQIFYDVLRERRMDGERARRTQPRAHVQMRKRAKP